MIALVTDSSSQLGPELAARWSVRIVPVTITIGGVDFAEGVDLSIDDFYRRLSDETGTPELTTTQPSAGAFVAAFESAVSDGHDEILAIVVGSAFSGSVNSAEVAAVSVMKRHRGIVIDVVDSGSASFGVSCAVWAAADAIAAGGDRAAARSAAIERSASTWSVFVIDGLELARRSGRFGEVDLQAEDQTAVLSSGPEGLAVIGHASSPTEAIDQMAGFVTDAGDAVVAAVGRATPMLDDVAADFRARLVAADNVRAVVDYRVGPSIAAHTGPNTLGAFVFPV